MESKAVKVNTKLLFLFNLHHFLKYIASWEIMPFLAIFSIAYIIMPLSPLIFGVVYLFIILMVYKLAFDVLADIARGHLKPTIKHNYLVSNVVGIKVALLALLIELTKMWLEKSSEFSDYTQDFIILSTFVTPAIYMSLAITNSLLHAMNPITIFKIIKTSYISYFLFVVFWILTLFLHDKIINPFLIHSFPNFINGIISSFIEYSLLLLNFQIMGYILFQNRVEFGLYEIAGFYSTTDDLVTVKEEQFNPYHRRIQNLLADDEPEQALAMATELQKDGDGSAELVRLYQQALQKKLHQPSVQEIAEKVHLFVRKNKTKRAFDLVYDLFEENKVFVEKSGNDIYPLLKHALSVNKIEYVKHLVKNFDKKYPKHSDLVANYFILAKVIYRNKENRWECKIILEKLIKNYPNDPMINEIKAWHKGMKLMQKKRTDL